MQPGTKRFFKRIVDVSVPLYQRNFFKVITYNDDFHMRFSAFRDMVVVGLIKDEAKLIAKGAKTL